MLKKLFISLILLTAFSGLVSSPQKNNDYLSIDGETVALRQKGFINKAIYDPPTANIETTNVDYDLRYIYGGDNGFQNFNIWSLLPKANEDKDTSYKFLMAKPVGKNLYLYAYINDNRNGDILGAQFNISKSKTQNTDTGDFEDIFSIYSARFINSYGYKSKFVKFCIDNVISLNDDVRCKISTFDILFRDVTTNKNYYMSNLISNDEFAFKNGGNVDFIGEYFKDEYVRITSGEVGLLLTRQDDVSGYSKYDEDFFYFFSSDHDIDELEEVQYDYQLLNYRERHADGRFRLGSGSFTPKYTAFIGLYKDAKEIVGSSVSSYSNQKIKMGKTVKTVIKPNFLWWSQKVTYELQNIQNCLDLSNLVGDRNKGFKDYIISIQNNRVNNGESKYDWCYKVAKTERVPTYELKNDGWSWLLGQNVFGLTDCHEVKQVLTTWLKYRTNGITFEFNALDIPKDTSSISVQNVPFKTIGDMLIDNAVSGFKWLSSIMSNIFKNIVPFAISIAVILIVVLCWPALSSVTHLFGSTLKGVSNRQEKNERKGRRKAVSNETNKKR